MLCFDILVFRSILINVRYFRSIHYTYFFFWLVAKLRAFRCPSTCVFRKGFPKKKKTPVLHLFSLVLPKWCLCYSTSSLLFFCLSSGLACYPDVSISWLFLVRSYHSSGVHSPTIDVLPRFSNWVEHSSTFLPALKQYHLIFFFKFHYPFGSKDC